MKELATSEVKEHTFVSEYLMWIPDKITNEKLGPQYSCVFCSSIVLATKFEFVGYR